MKIVFLLTSLMVLGLVQNRKSKRPKTLNDVNRLIGKDFSKLSDITQTFDQMHGTSSIRERKLLLKKLNSKFL